MSNSEKAGELCLIVIDDDDEDRSLTQRCLNRLMPGSSIELYTDGEQALERLCKIQEPGGASADLVLIDQRMPGLNGLQVMEQLRDSGVASRVPIILFSSAVPPSEVSAVLAAGAKAYVPKPVDPDLYQEAVAQILRDFVRAST